MSAVHFVKETQQFQSKIDILKNVIIIIPLKFKNAGILWRLLPAHRHDDFVVNFTDFKFHFVKFFLDPSHTFADSADNLRIYCS